MPEVRSIPSAVGAYEAQVIDFSGITREMARAAQLKQKQAAEEAAAVDKMIDRTMVDNRTTRVQDDPYLSSMRDEIYDFYDKNRKSILSGGSAYSEMKQRMGKLKSEIGKSNTLFKMGQSFVSVYRDGLRRGDQFEATTKEAFSNWEKPINDKAWNEYTIKRPDGSTAPLDQFSVDDIQYGKAFDEKVDIVDKFKPTDFHTVTYEEVGGENKFGFQLDKTTQIKMVMPSVTANWVNQASISKPTSFTETYGKLFDMYRQQYNNDPKMMELDFNGVVDAYKDIAKVDISTMFNQGQPGIDTPYEFALFSNMKRNMPYIAKKTYDYSTQSMLFKQQMVDIAKQRANLARQKFFRDEKTDEDLPQQIASAFSNPNAVGSINDIDNYINSYINNPDFATGGAKSAWVESKSLGGKVYQHTVYQQRPVINGATGNPAASEAEARAIVGGSGILKGIKNSDGTYSFYNQVVRTVTIDYGKKTAIGEVESKIINPAIESSQSTQHKVWLKERTKKMPKGKQFTQEWP